MFVFQTKCQHNQAYQLKLAFFGMYIIYLEFSRTQNTKKFLKREMHRWSFNLSEMSELVTHLAKCENPSFNLSKMSDLVTNQA